MKNRFFIVGIVMVVLLAGLFISVQQIARNWKKVEEVLPEPVQDKLAWGLKQDSILIDTFQIARNQNLSDILFKFGLSAQKIDQVAQCSRPVFDVRRIRLGNNYYLIRNNAATSLSHLIYEETPTDYVVFELGDSVSVYRGSKPIDNVQKIVNGEIRSSLWNAMTDQGINPLLALDMSEIFAWTIDFFGIQKGDTFKAIYQEQFVDSTSIGLGRISAAVFVHMGEPIYAFYFNANGQEGYFDKDGKSLKKAFLKAPLNYSRISSHFSHSRMHPILKYRRPHHGVDYAAPSGTPVYSIGEGTVIQKSYQSGGGGNYLTIRHNSIYTSQYMHLQGYAKGIATGVRVKQGQLIGYVGATGLASGPHLDFRMFKSGDPVDPLKVKSPPVEPISEANALLFAQLKDSLLMQMEVVPVEEKPDVTLAKK